MKTTKRLSALTQKQKQVLKKLSLRDHPVAVATLNCSERVCERLAQQGLARVATLGIGNHGKRAWEITRNGLVLQNMIEPGSVVIPELETK